MQMKKLTERERANGNERERQREREGGERTASLRLLAWSRCWYRKYRKRADNLKLLIARDNPRRIREERGKRPGRGGGEGGCARGGERLISLTRGDERK